MDSDWKQFAVILIDIQKDFWTQETKETNPHFEENVENLLGWCRSINLDVIHIRAGFNKDQSDWMQKYKLTGSIPCVKGTGGEAPLECALEDSTEALIWKNTFDGFYQPELEALLRAKNKKFILTAGLITSVCVLLTTASAMQRGFLTAIIDDCCSDKLEAHCHVITNYSFLFDLVKHDKIQTKLDDWHRSLEAIE